MSNDEKRILEMLQEMNQIADLALNVRKISEMIDMTVLAANQKTIELVKGKKGIEPEISFSEALGFIRESSAKVTHQLNCLINEVSGLSNTNLYKEV